MPTDLGLGGQQPEQVVATFDELFGVVELGDPIGEVVDQPLPLLSRFGQEEQRDIFPFTLDRALVLGRRGDQDPPERHLYLGRRQARRVSRWVFAG
jgi:hypothetical protein